MDNKTIFLNNSINKEESDVIGFDTYVNKLSDAIDSGAQMIAITSPFGSGKTSIIDLLVKKREERKREQILKIPMWSQLNKFDCENKSSELHKNFLYQIGSAINSKKGTYINRRLSGNYGLLKLHVNKPVYWILLIVSIILIAFGWCSNNYPDMVTTLFPVLSDFVPFIFPVSCVLVIALITIIITRAEIIFSSKNSEKNRTIEADEIIDLYRNEIIKNKGKIVSFFIRQLRKIPLVKKIHLLKEKSILLLLRILIGQIMVMLL